MIVIKRDGRRAEFDESKIQCAITKAFQEVDGEVTEFAANKAKEISRHIASLGDNQDKIRVEDIQDIVEDKLMASSRKDVARTYIIYRNERNKVRERNSALMRTIKTKIMASDVQNQNANVDEKSFGGRMGEATDTMLKQFALDDIVSKQTKENHLNNEVYIHDLGHYAIGDHNCLSVPFDKLLAEGFNTRQTDIRPAQSVSTALQLVAVLFQVQSLQQFGGVSSTHLDWTMVPYVRKSFYKHYRDGLKYIRCYSDDDIERSMQHYRGIESKCIEIDDTDVYTDEMAYGYAMDMTTREIYQAVEGLYHNLNTLQSRSGNQLPFSSINYGTCTSTEGRMVTKALLDVSIKGIGKLHKTPIFPCGIFQLAKGINREKGDPNYDLYLLALKSTSMRLYPNYANIDWSGNEGYDPNDPRTFFSTMGKCKLRPIQNRLNLCLKGVA